MEKNWYQRARKILQQNSIPFLADHSHEFHVQMKSTAITETIAFILK